MNKNDQAFCRKAKQSVVSPSTEELHAFFN